MGTFEEDRIMQQVTTMALGCTAPLRSEVKNSEERKVPSDLGSE